MRCEGWHRYGGIFTFGPVKWKQCENQAIVMVEIEQDGKVETLPSCETCWKEGIANKIKILKVSPLPDPPKEEPKDAGLDKGR